MAIGNETTNQPLADALTLKADLVGGFVKFAQIPIGSSAATVVVGNDSRLSDSRAPTAHATTHKAGGSDPIALDTLAAPTDVTTLNATSGAHGLLPKLPGTTTTWLRGDGTFTTVTDANALHSGDAAKITQTLSLTGQVTDIVDAAFTNANVAGLYRVSVYLVDTTADVTAGAVTANVKYTDAAGVARTQSVGPVALTATTQFGQATFFVQLASGSITLGTTHSGLFGASNYAVYAICERIA